jgi:lysozyme
VVAGQVITEEQGESLLRSDLQTAERAVNNYVRIALNQNQYDALVSFVFNVGTGNFKFSTLLKYLNVGNVRAAADELDRWNKVKGQPVAGLTKRRAQEKALFLEG